MDREETKNWLAKAKGHPLEGLFKLLAAASPNEDLSLIIQVHLLIEECLNSILEESLQNPELLDIDRLGFARKAQLVCALGAIQKDLYGAIAQFNKIRNKFAHNSERAIEQADVESVWALLPNDITKSDKNIVRDSTPKANMIIALGYMLAPIHGTMEGLKRQKQPRKPAATLLTGALKKDS